MGISSLNCSANQWTGFHMIVASLMKGLKLEMCISTYILIFSCIMLENGQTYFKDLAV